MPERGSPGVQGEVTERFALPPALLAAMMAALVVGAAEPRCGGRGTRELAFLRRQRHGRRGQRHRRHARARRRRRRSRGRGMRARARRRARGRRAVAVRVGKPRLNCMRLGRLAPERAPVAARRVRAAGSVEPEAEPEALERRGQPAAEGVLREETAAAPTPAPESTVICVCRPPVAQRGRPPTTANTRGVVARRVLVVATPRGTRRGRMARDVVRGDAARHWLQLSAHTVLGRETHGWRLFSKWVKALAIISPRVPHSANT